MTIADRVKQKRMKLGLTQTELATLIGITQQSLQKIEDGKTQNPRKLLSLSKALNCEPEWLQFGKNAEIREPIPYYDNLASNQVKSKNRPIISHDKIINWPEIDLKNEQTQWLNTPPSASDNSFWLKVIGDHMTSPSGLSVPEGYFILVDPSLPPKNRNLVVARMKSQNEITFKQLIIDAGRSYLKPLNSNYHPIEMNGNFQIIGVVKEARLIFAM